MKRNDEKVLYIIAGANGSGKSTLAEVLLKKKKLVYLNADDIAKEISPNAINKVPISAGKIYFQKLNEYLKNNISFAVESTLSGNNILKIIEKAKLQNYKIVLVYAFLQNCTTCIERVEKRVKNGGHNVPAEDIIRRYYKSFVRFWQQYRLLSDEWTLFFNGFEYAPIVVAYGSKSSYTVVNDKLQNKFLEILKQIEENK